MGVAIKRTGEDDLLDEDGDLKSAEAVLSIRLERGEDVMAVVFRFASQNSFDRSSKKAS